MSCSPQASFKNSRDFPRKPTQTAVVSNPTATVASASIAANTARTYLTIENESGTLGDDIRFAYGAVIPTALTGFLLKAGSSVDIESPQQVNYIRAGANDVKLSVDEGSG
jgi:hypothetical protein